jgi:hypothetical protein
MQRKKELTKEIGKKGGDVERKKVERNGTKKRVKDRKKEKLEEKERNKEKDEQSDVLPTFAVCWQFI